MAKILNDFADLGELKVQLSQEDVVPSVKPPHIPLVQIRLQGNVNYNYNTYLDAAVAAIKAYPIISINYKTIQFTSSKKEQYLALGEKGHRFFFRFNQMSDKKRFKSADRIAAFRTIMFVYTEARKIAASHIQIVEDAIVGNFVLTINEIPLVSSSYKRYTGNFPFLKALKGQMMIGAIMPTDRNEEDALQMGIKIRERVQDLSTLDGMEIIPEKDYSAFRHEEKIRVSTKPGYVEPDIPAKDVKKQKTKVYPGRSTPGPPPKVRPPEPWLVNKWADRYDHDD